MIFLKTNLSGSWVPNGSPPLPKEQHIYAMAFPESQNLHLNEQTMEADCKKQAQTVYTCK